MSIVLSAGECRLIRDALLCAADHYGNQQFTRLHDWIKISEMLEHDSVENQIKVIEHHVNEVRDLIYSKEGY